MKRELVASIVALAAAPLAALADSPLPAAVLAKGVFALRLMAQARPADARSVNLGESFSLAPGEEAVIPAADLAVALEGLRYRRCRPGAICAAPDGPIVEYRETRASRFDEQLCWSQLAAATGDGSYRERIAAPGLRADECYRRLR